MYMYFCEISQIAMLSKNNFSLNSPAACYIPKTTEVNLHRVKVYTVDNVVSL